MLYTQTEKIFTSAQPLWETSLLKVVLMEPEPLPLRMDKDPANIAVSLVVSDASTDCEMDMLLISICGIGLK